MMGSGSEEAQLLWPRSLVHLEDPYHP